MRCVSCGRGSPEGFKFCQSCGAILARPIDLQDRRLEAPRQMIARAIHERQRTDRKLSILWVEAIILIIVASIILFIVVLFSILANLDAYSYDPTNEFASIEAISGIIGIALTVLFATLTYLLVKRQNDHYDRETRLRRGIVALIRAAAWSPEKMNDIAPEMMALSTVERRLEKHRNVWFWVFVVVLPPIVDLISTLALWVAGDPADTDTEFRAWVLVILLTAAVALIDLVLIIYLLFFLTKTMQEHDGRWNIFAYNARRALTKLGFRHGMSYRVSRLPERSMPLYVLLTLFTGIFALYWFYALIKDPNDHFTYQWEFEDNMLSAMNPYEGLPTSSVSPQ